MCIAKAAVHSHLSEHDQDHCGECHDKHHWNWTQPTKLIASDAEGFDYLGWSVATSGNQVFAGSATDDNDRGSVSVFELNQSSGIWGEKTKLVASDRFATASFGSSLAVSGDVLVVGAIGDQENGSAYVFEKDPSRVTGLNRQSLGQVMVLLMNTSAAVLEFMETPLW